MQPPAVLCGSMEESETMPTLPSLFISHGAPSFALEPGVAGPQLTALGQALPKPQAVLIVSPHWTTPQVRVATSAQPETIHDFGGFARALYSLRYPAPGHPELAARVVALLADAGWHAEPDARWGLDHGAWVPLTYLYPAADVPVFQVSMPQTLDMAGAYALGQALSPLSREGVLIVGSGSLTHNLYEFRAGQSGAAAYAQEFVQWVRAAVVEGDHASLLRTLALAPHAQRAHPSAEHFLPLLVAAGASVGNAPPRQVTVLDGGFTHGVLSMESYVFGATTGSHALVSAAQVEAIQHA